jgi:deoxyribodipyrimidine photolyase
VNEILIQNNDKTESIFWFRRDLRLEDNIGLFHALESEYPVIPLFIYDDAILDSLPKNDPRVGFIHESLNINDQLKQIGSSLLVKKEKLLYLKRFLKNLISKKCSLIKIMSSMP